MCMRRVHVVVGFSLQTLHTHNDLPLLFELNAGRGDSAECNHKQLSPHQNHTETKYRAVSFVVVTVCRRQAKINDWLPQAI